MLLAALARYVVHLTDKLSKCHMHTVGASYFTVMTFKEGKGKTQSLLPYMYREKVFFYKRCISVTEWIL